MWTTQAASRDGKNAYKSMGRKCRFMGSNDTKKGEVELWAKKGQPAGSQHYVKLEKKS